MQWVLLHDKVSEEGECKILARQCKAHRQIFLVAKMKNKSLSSMPLKRLSPKSSRSLNFSASSLSEAWSREGVSFPWIWLSKLNSQRTWLSSMLHCSSSSCQLKPFPIESLVPDVSLLLFFLGYLQSCNSFF